MNSPIVTALIYAMVPSAVAVVGTAAATFWHPSEAFRSGLLHFAAGAAFAVVAVELLPRVMHGHGALPWVISGFGLGVLIMLGVRWLEHTLTARAGQQRWPLGLIGGGAVDQVIDGLLGISIAQGAGLGVLLSVSMAAEDLTFGLAIATSFGAACGVRWQKIGTAAALGARCS